VIVVLAVLDSDKVEDETEELSLDADEVESVVECAAVLEVGGGVLLPPIVDVGVVSVVTVSLVAVFELPVPRL